MFQKVLHANGAGSALATYNYYGQRNLPIYGTAQSNRFYGTGKWYKVPLGAWCKYYDESFFLGIVEVFLWFL